MVLVVVADSHRPQAPRAFRGGVVAEARLACSCESWREIPYVVMFACAATHDDCSKKRKACCTLIHGSTKNADMLFFVFHAGVVEFANRISNAPT